MAVTRFELPCGWEWSTLGELTAHLRRGRGPKYAQEPVVPVINQKCIRWGTIDTRWIKYATRAHYNSLPSEHVLQDGDLLWNSTGIGTIGRAAIFRGQSSSPTICDSHVTIVRPIDVLPEYLLYWIWSDHVQNSMDALNAGSTGQIELSRTEAMDLPVPVAPLSEQHRIVEKIETLLSDVANGVESLNAVDRNLSSYRQSVLKAAVTGDLTRDWRRNRSQVFEAVPNSRSLPFKPPFEVPAGWRWATIGDLGSVSGGLTKNRKRSAHALQAPFLRVANVYHDELRLDDVHQVGLTERELEKTRLERDDLLVVEGNGSIDQIGRVALWDGSISNCVHQNHLIRVRFPYSALSRYALTWLLSPPGRAAIEAVAASTSGLHTLSIRKVSALPIPLPPDEELGEILGAVDRASTADKSTNSAVASETARAANLRRSVLNSAFSGRLVQPVPEDEPASDLLARIRAERANAPKTSGRRGRPRKTSRTSEGAPQ